MKTKTVDLSKLSPEQREAFIQFYRDARKAAPQVKQTQSDAQTLFREWMRSPTWQAAEGQAPQDVPDQTWSVKPQINYVDSFEDQ